MVKKFKWYPAEDEKKPFTRKSKAKKKRAAARKGMNPGVVCIVLSGRFRGKRVLFLRMLPSGLALVTGPYKVNGVPLRRMNTAYLLVTKTQVNVEVIQGEAANIDDKYFAKAKEAKKKEEDKLLADTSAYVTKILAKNYRARDTQKKRKKCKGRLIDQ